MNSGTILYKAMKAFAGLVYGIEPRMDESLDSYVGRVDKIMRRTRVSEDEKIAESS